MDQPHILYHGLSRFLIMLCLFQDGGTPLFVACQCNHLDVVKELVGRGANIHRTMNVSKTHSLLSCNQQVTSQSAIWFFIVLTGAPLKNTAEYF